MKEFKKYSPHDLGILTQSRFELLSLVAFHQGKLIPIFTLMNNRSKLFSVVVVIHDFISQNAPNAITLSIHEFVAEVEPVFHRLAHSPRK